MLEPKEKFISHYFELKRAHDQISIPAATNLAVILRLFLKDGFIHKANKLSKHQVKLCFPVDMNQDRVLENHIFLAGFRLATEPIPGETVIRKMDIKQFLSFKILRAYSKEFSIGEVIDIVANKLGNAHYNPHQAAKVGLNPFDQKIAKAIINSICRICQSVAKACEQISKTIIPIDYSRSLGHWMIDQGTNEYIESNGRQWMEVDLSSSVTALELTFFIASRFLPIKSKDAIAIDIQLKDNQNIAFGYNWKGNTFIEFTLANKIRRIDFETSNLWGTIGRMGVYRLSLEALDDCIFGKMVFIAQGRIEHEEPFGTPIDGFSFRCDRMVFGADYKGERGTRMKMGELALFAVAEDSAIEDFSRYLMAKYELA